MTSSGDGGRRSAPYALGWRRRAEYARYQTTPTRRRLLGRDFDELDAGRRLGYRLAVFLEAFEVKLDGAVNELHDLVAGFGGGHAARQIGDVRTEALGTCRRTRCERSPRLAKG